MRTHIVRFWLLSFFILGGRLTQAQDSQAFERIMQNIREAQWFGLQNATGFDFSNGNVHNVESLDKRVGYWSAKMSLNGSWDDIDYKSRTQTAWIPSQHLVRLHQLVLGYTLSNSQYYDNPQLFTQIEQSFQYWWDVDPRSTNWWNQQIFCPKQVGEMLILMRSGKQQLNKTLENKLLTRMKEIGGEPDGIYSGGGSNRINIAAHWIYRGCLIQDRSVLEEGVKNALLPVRFCPPAGGVQYDFSYQEHGQQLYIGNYGNAFVDNISNMALYLKNTEYALSGDQLKLFSQYVRYTYIPTVRGQYYSFSHPGRQVANKGGLNKAGSVGVLEKMIAIDPAYAQVYNNAIQRWAGKEPASYKVGATHHQYWISDYTAHARPDYFFDVRYVSDRTVRTENINNENKKGFFLSDGATNMTIKGDEYLNVFGAWDWCKVPGVTAPQLDSLPDMKVAVGGPAGVGNFSGGVSDSVYGTSVYMMDYAMFKTQAKKSWFFFDKEIVCLGTDINSDYGRPVATTVNQALSKGNIIISQKTLLATYSHLFGEKKYDGQLDWILHNGFGYYFPQGGNIVVANKVQTGNWYTISVSQQNKVVKDSVFSLWFDHGTNPKGQQYAYYVVPNINDANAMRHYVAENKMQIIANNGNQQSVWNQQLQMLQAVLFSKKQQVDFDKNYSLQLDAPCVVMLQRKEGKFVGYIADPTQKLQNIVVKLLDKKNKKETKLDIPLPKGVEAGKSVRFQF